VRRWLWPYAILTVVLVVIGCIMLFTVVSGLGVERTGAQASVAYAKVVEPGMRFVTSMVGIIAPFDVPQWLKELYAALILVAIAGIGLSIVVGLLLLPVFYALYRSQTR
jgi:hypothetical protein